MTTKEMSRGVQEQEDIGHRALTMALGILVERIQRLPKEDREDLYELMKELPRAETADEVNSIVTTMEEILDQKPIRLRRLELVDQDVRLGCGLQKWIAFVSEKIRALRKEADLTQEELAERSGLPQSHISRLENGQHSPSRATLEKIARALGVEVGVFDPSA